MSLDRPASRGTAMTLNGSMPPNQSSPVGIYIGICRELKIKPNSKLVKDLTEKEKATKATKNSDGSAQTPMGLTELVLKANYCGCEAGFRALLLLIRNLPSLKMIDFSYNFMTTANVKDFVAAALVHPALEEVNLIGNSLFLESAVELLRLARHNPRMKRILIDEVELGGESTAAATPAAAPVKGAPAAAGGTAAQADAVQAAAAESDRAQQHANIIPDHLKAKIRGQLAYNIQAMTASSNSAPNSSRGRSRERTTPTDGARPRSVSDHTPPALTRPPTKGSPREASK